MFVCKTCELVLDTAKKPCVGIKVGINAAEDGGNRTFDFDASDLDKRIWTGQL